MKSSSSIAAQATIDLKIVGLMFTACWVVWFMGFVQMLLTQKGGIGVLMSFGVLAFSTLTLIVEVRRPVRTSSGIE